MSLKKQDCVLHVMSDSRYTGVDKRVQLPLHRAQENLNLFPALGNGGTTREFWVECFTGTATILF
jgi:hypothetical protein